MSQVSSFIQGDDGKWYQNPTIGEKGKWFICFDDDDPDELVIARDSGLAIKDILPKVPFKKDSDLSSCGTRCFDGVYKVARNCWLVATGPIPVAMIINKPAVFDSKPQREGCFGPDWSSNGSNC